MPSCSCATACAHPAPVATCPPAAPAPAPIVVTQRPAALVTPKPLPGEPAAPIASIASGYNKPPQYVLDVLHAPSPPQPVVSPTHDSILLVSWVKYPPITQVAEPFLKLAGVRVEPRTRRKHDTPGGYGVAPCAQTLAIVDVASTHETPIALPRAVASMACLGPPTASDSRSATPARMPSSCGSATPPVTSIASATRASIRCSAARCNGCRIRSLCS